MPGALRSRLPILVAALALLALLAWWLWPKPPAAPSAPPPVPVGLATVEQRDVPQWVRGIGSVESLHAVTLRPQVEGVLAEVRFREGQDVRRGELLARIDDREYAAALLRAEADLASNRAQLVAGEQDLARYRALLEEEAVSQQTVEQQTATTERLRAAVKASEAAVATAQVQLSYTRITAPVGGRVGLRRVDPGNLVRTGDTEGLVTVTQLDPISVIFSLPQEQLSRLHPLLKGEAAEVTAYDRDNGTALAQGRLATVDNQVDPASGMVRLRAEFANQDGKLWPGQFVAMRLRIGAQPAALVVPTQAVRQGLKGPFAFRVRDDKAELVPLEVGYQDDEIAIITKGLGAGDRIVVDGHSRLKPGTAVRDAAAKTGGGA
ncbi:efflux RND transporter periplasmic adaptor subunit [Solimonas sp. SE-A11]|uniref:efflux RND transporter periplasmic adaptor subunit n=1 Tax=Solimonas sp. SE-A11 TaxID=3054954 RepID=UPI00259D217E|nr:efflux RND transporter periplasmic adaptor subunit [Solimonas sp. SE-A11]MDM4772673.1 efflux RND transporter periplasmic adaptor subunit [Solimonas sp. SE-A11]